MDESEQQNFTEDLKHMKGAPLHPKAYSMLLEKNDNLPRK